MKVLQQIRELNVLFKILLVVSIIFYFINLRYIFVCNNTFALHLKQDYFGVLRDKAFTYDALYPIVSTASYAFMLIIKKFNKLTISLITLYNITYIVITTLLTIIFW